MTSIYRDLGGLGSSANLKPSQPGLGLRLGPARPGGSEAAVKIVKSQNILRDDNFKLFHSGPGLRPETRPGRRMIIMI